MSEMHFKRSPVASTLKLISEAPVDRLRTGFRAAVEVVAYPDGQFRLVTSRVEGEAGNRRIVQQGFLIFIDGDEAKDALDALVDRLDALAREPQP